MNFIAPKHRWVAHVHSGPWVSSGDELRMCTTEFHSIKQETLVAHAPWGFIVSSLATMLGMRALGFPDSPVSAIFYLVPDKEIEQNWSDRHQNIEGYRNIHTSIYPNMEEDSHPKTL